MMKIINLTQHPATPEQEAAGVFQPADPAAVRELLNFVGKPTVENVCWRADKLAEIAKESGATHAMIGGAPYLMYYLHESLDDVGIYPLYAFSERVSVEKTLPDGSVEKTNVFKHVGFVGEGLPENG